MLVAAGAEHPEALQASPQLGAFLALPGGQAVGQGAVSVAEAENFDGLRVVDAPGTQVGQGLGGAEEGGVVVLDDLGQGSRRRRRRARPVTGGGAPCERAGARAGQLPGGFARAQQLDGVAEADALGPHHPVDASTLPRGRPPGSATGSWPG